MCRMASPPFDEPGLLAAMRAFVQASAALDAASGDVEVLNRSEAKALAGMSLRKRLLELGWTAPSTQRTRT